MSRDQKELVSFLSDMYSVEQQAIAQLAHDPQTLGVAFAIRNQERAIVQRLEQDFDAAEAISHRDVYRRRYDQIIAWTGAN